MGTAAIKVCTTCGADLANQKRVKDTRGQYFCHPCWNAGSRPSKQQPEHVSPPDGTSDSLAELAAAATTSRVSPSVAAALTATERRIIYAGVVVGLVVVLGAVYFLCLHGKWERESRDTLLALKEDAEALAHKGDLAAAKRKYDDLFGLLGDHQVSDESLRQELIEARSRSDDVTAQLAQQQLEAETQQRDAEARRKEEEARQTEHHKKIEAAVVGWAELLLAIDRPARRGAAIAVDEI